MMDTECAAQRQLRFCLTTAAMFCLTLGLASCGPSGTNTIRSNDRALVREALQAAPTHGFGANLFPVNDANLGDEIIAYAEAQHGVDRDPSAIVHSWGMRGALFDANAELAQAEATGHLRDWIASLPPPSTQYAALRAAFARYQRIVAAGGWPQLPPGAILRPGATGPSVALLRQRLAMEAPFASVANPALFDAGLAQALRHAQLRYGIEPTGMLDDSTRRALNVPAQTRLMQIKANLQRWRWAPRHPSATRIDVNVAAGVAAYYVDNAPRLQMRVAVGRPGDETPMLTSTIRSIVINPPWNVPDSIAERELLPREQREPGYLASHGFVQISDNGQTRLQQTAGPQSALGAVKFVFENRYGVYLHDTPSRAAFAQARRSVSHGCVRLERAVDLANMMLAGQGWSGDRLSQAIAAGETTEVRLAAPVPVRLFYWTAWVSRGQVSFRDDIYGWDEATASLADGVVQRPPRVLAANETPAAPTSPEQTDNSDEYIPAQNFNDYAASGEDTPEQSTAEANAPAENSPEASPQSDQTPK